MWNLTIYILLGTDQTTKFSYVDDPCARRGSGHGSIIVVDKISPRAEINGDVNMIYVY